MNSADTRENFEWLVDLLDKECINTPRMIFFSKSRTYVRFFKHVLSSLGRKAFINYQETGPNDDRNCLIDMFHMKTTDVVKASICQSYEDPDGHIRVVLCTTSFSMGLDVKVVHTVVHYGPANNLEDYIQETGRAGRNPTENCHALMLKYKRSTDSKNVSSDMKQYVLTKLCRCRNLLKSFTLDLDSISPTPAHLYVCTKLCKCLCKCTLGTKCNCDPLCCFQQNVVMEFISKTKDFSSTCESDQSETGFESDSDCQGYRSKRPNVLHFF